MTLNRSTELVGTLFRVVVGVLFGLHGAATIFGLFGGVMGSGQPAPVGTWPAWWAGVIQLVGGLLVVLGLGTRVSALICSGSMAYAYFVVHQPLGLLPMQNGGELAALFCWSFLLIAALGPGRLALDHALTRRSRVATPAAPEREPALTR
ncbi:DoxX family protein [Allorhizocola rhizosphaerae]|uniref:DoxX family protein n=1 Tax=Allorhizocola rhizosphaerae TaxID=1872709 RepID=UPI000E3DE3D9|nr:DoxX family protein [Allorhizocola rhizosphaerae]